MFVGFIRGTPGLGPMLPVAAAELFAVQTAEAKELSWRVQKAATYVMKQSVIRGTHIMWSLAWMDCIFIPVLMAAVTASVPLAVDLEP